MRWHIKPGALLSGAKLPKTTRSLSWFGRRSSAANAGLFQKGYSKSKDFEVETTKALKEIEEYVEECKTCDLDHVVEAIDTLSNRICLTADLSDCVRSIHPNQKIAESADNCHQTLGTYVEQLNSSSDLHDPLKRFCESPRLQEVEEDTYRCATLLLHDFEKSGINLPEKEREEYVQIHSDIINNQSSLAQSAREPSIFAKKDISSQLLNEMVNYRIAEEITIGGQAQVFQYYWLARHPDNEMRKQSYLNYFHRPDLHENNQALFDSRKQMAQALGFGSFAERALLLAAPKGPEEVKYFLETLSNNLRPYLNNDIKLLQTQLQTSTVGPWDVNCVDGGSRKRDISNHLNIYKCFDGFSQLAEILFGVKLERAEPLEGEIWHQDVIKFNVSHKEHGDYGVIYVDPFSRYDKRCIDCHFTVQCGKQLKDKYQNPIIVVSLSCQNNINGCISHDELTTLFHEMGHAVHSILARTRYQHLFGTRISTDFAEVPSTLFEKFACDARVLKMFATHYKTNEPLNLSLEEETMLRNKTSSRIPAVELQYTIFNALCDLELHGPSNERMEEIIGRVAQNHAPFIQDGYSGWWNRFSHFAIYGAKYYSYVYAQAVAGRIWKKLFEGNPFDQGAGEALRDGFLRHGNGLAPSQMYLNCTEEILDPDILINQLITEFEEANRDRYLLQEN